MYPGILRLWSIGLELLSYHLLETALNVLLLNFWL
jgi:hypothetical protein